MVLLREGDRLPSVALVQLLLNSWLPSLRPKLRVDGHFGPKTEQAVIKFHHEILHRQGQIKEVGPTTWRALTEQTRYQVRDFIDIFDPLLHESRQVVEAHGSQPIVMGGMSNGVAQIASAIFNSGVAPGTLGILRFAGHGNRGSQVVSYGTTVHILFDALRNQPVPDLHSIGTPEQVGVTPAEASAMALASSRSRISLSSIDLPEVQQGLARIRPFFGPGGSIELHGCQVGGGADGQRFVRRLANMMRVPVTAARVKQTTGDAIRFKLPIITACPDNQSLREWGASLPPILASW